MSEQFKPLADQVSERMVNLLNDNRSIFTKPQKEDGSSQFVLPINARSKQKYTGPAALVLIMQNRRDSRWLSFDKALYNKTPVKKGAYGTLIEFNSTNELRPKVKDGQPELNKDGKQKMERVKLDVPVPVQAWLYNGKDLVGLRPLKVKENPLSPTERAQVILDNSGIMQNKDAVKAYDTPQLYYAAALHHLAHDTVKTQLPEIKDKAREELRTNIASVLIGAELNLPYVLDGHQEYLKQWATLLKDNPKELFSAATDAQLVVNQVLAYEAKREQQQDTKQAAAQETKATQTVQTAAKLTEGMEIAYNGTTYKVMAEQSRGAVKLEDLTNGDKHRVKPSDGLYKSLVAQLNNPVQHQVREQEIGQEHEEEQGEELEMAETEAEEQTKSYSRRR